MTIELQPQANVIRANLLATRNDNPVAINRVYYIAFGEAVTLNELHGLIAAVITSQRPGISIERPVHGDFRAGDVRYSLDDIDKARQLLGYSPTHSVRSGLIEAIGWYVEALAPAVA